MLPGRLGGVAADEAVTLYSLVNEGGATAVFVDFTDALAAGGRGGAELSAVTDGSCLHHMCVFVSAHKHNAY
jgi:hypothetical protein